METYKEIRRPSKIEQELAIVSYKKLSETISQLTTTNPEIEIEETGEKIKIPLSALKLLGEVLKTMSKGVPFSIVPIATEVTTQKAAEILGCSRPHIVKLLEDGVLPYVKVGKHRRIKFDDILKYRSQMKSAQKRNLIEIMRADEELGLYDT